MKTKQLERVLGESNTIQEEHPEQETGCLSLTVREHQAEIFLTEKQRKKLLDYQIKIEGCLDSIKVNVYEIGRYLSYAKNLLDHGQFKKWIKETFGLELPYSTAWLYKSIYESFPKQPECVRRLPLGLLSIMKQDSFPTEIKALISAHPEAFVQADMQTYSKTYSMFKRGEFSQEEFYGQTKKLIQLAAELTSGETRSRHSKLVTRCAVAGFIDMERQIKRATENFKKVISALPTETTAKEQTLGRLGFQDELIIKMVDKSIAALTELKRELIGTGAFTKKIVEGERGKRLSWVDASERRKIYERSKI